MEIIDYYYERGTIGIYVRKRNNQLIAPFIQFSLQDIWWVPSVKWLGQEENILTIGWLFFYFGIVYISKAQIEG